MGVVGVMVGLGVVCRVGDRVGSWVGWGGVEWMPSFLTRNITPRWKSHKQGLPATPHADNAQ